MADDKTNGVEVRGEMPELQRDIQNIFLDYLERNKEVPNSGEFFEYLGDDEYHPRVTGSAFYECFDSYSELIRSVGMVPHTGREAQDLMEIYYRLEDSWGKQPSFRDLEDVKGVSPGSFISEIGNLSDIPLAVMGREESKRKHKGAQEKEFEERNRNKLEKDIFEAKVMLEDKEDKYYSAFDFKYQLER